MSKNNMANIMTAAVSQGKAIGRVNALRELAEKIDNERKAMIEKQFDGEYNRGYVDGLNKAYMSTLAAARRRLP
jgi:hypothetical protein